MRSMAMPSPGHSQRRGEGADAVALSEPVHDCVTLQQQHPKRCHHYLTDKGRDLRPAMLALAG